MSHITTIKTAIRFKDQSLLRQVLNQLALETPGLRIVSRASESGEPQLLVRYAPIEKFRQENLRFTLRNGEYQMEGDSYAVPVAFKEITDRIQVGYQQAALQQVLTRKRYTSQSKTIAPDCVTMTARRA